MTTPYTTFEKIHSPYDPLVFLHQLEAHRIEAQEKLDKARRAEWGQFLTPPTVALLMADMFSTYPASVKLLDAGAGAGTLSAAFVAKTVSSPSKPKRMVITAFELDPHLIPTLTYTLNQCSKLCKQNQIEFEYIIKQEDFITSSVETLAGRDSLFAVTQPDYNCAILNPPYKKINSSSKTKHMLSMVGVDTTNLYSAFLWLAIKLLVPNGEMVAIVPRSFCNGTYYRPFRLDLLKTMAMTKVHVFESRDQAFKESDVLQENIIFHCKKTDEPRTKVTISTSQDPRAEDVKVRELDYDLLINPKDPDAYIRIIPDQLGNQIDSQIGLLTTTLRDLGITVSTGRVVDFRLKDFLRMGPDAETIPLLYPANLKNGKVVWPITIKDKPTYMASSQDINRYVVPAYNYVLVKRFSAKEEKRRIYAALFEPEKIPVKKLGIENHLNYFHSRYGGLTKAFAKGLTLFLNSTLVDEYFRQFSGHTQVNAADLVNLKYPTEAQLFALGDKVGEEFPSQDEIDHIVAEELALNEQNEESMSPDPIQAKKRIREALSILQKLNVPKAQQNDRSALTLLALINLKPHSSWSDASENLIGITEMMEFFKTNYGITYAPNTRETVRRQTIHQFIQMGLVIANPDDPSRPINSPKTRYIMDENTLELARSYGAANWDNILVGYLTAASSLSSLQVRERTMPMIPVNLPNGEEILLSSGGQNELIKRIIEEFCPRFTPGGRVVYIGDAGQKLTEQEIEYFETYGIHLDKHGKMPDVIIDYAAKKWLVLIEAVTSHGPIDIKRHNELKTIFSSGEHGLVFVTAFETRKALNKYLTLIAWETEVWVAEAPSHLIHFNGERFLGPY